MATTKIILKTEKAKSNGEVPLYLRIIKDRKAKFISLGIAILPKHWNDKENTVRKSHSNSVYLNNFLAHKIADAQSVALEMETKSKYVTPKSIKQAITGKTTEQFIPYAERYYTSLDKKGRIASHRRAKTTVEKVKKYIGKTDFTFDDLNIFFLKKYEEYLRDEIKNAPNTIHTDLKIIRHIINEAINDDLFPLEKNPFLKYKLKWQNTEKAFLTEKELKALEELNLNPKSMKYHHRNIYIFAAYTGGIRISDICKLRWEHFDGERLLLNTTKTGSVISIKLPTKALEIIHLYQVPGQQPHHFIFPFLSNQKDYSNHKTLLRAISSITTYTNTDLKDLAKDAKITKNLHFHTSRHTWATRALRKGMRIEYVSKLMGHSSIKTTQVYAKIVNEELDKAMDVFN
jgi:integrase/recombinase XerD